MRRRTDQRTSMFPNDCGRPGCGYRGGYRRGLCVQCYNDPVLRQLYATVSEKCRKGLGLGLATGVRPLPEPTEATPGTPEKLAVLEYRAGAGQQLFHPLDAGNEDYSPAEVAERLERALLTGW